MDIAELTDAAPGRLVQAPGGVWAFAPNSLPPELDLDRRMVRRLAEAERALGRLAGVGQTLPNPHLLIGPFLRREAVLSSRIEGTTTTLQQLLLFEASPARERADEREVHNYVLALEHGLARLAHLPVSLRLIRELHERLLTSVRGQETNPGHFRRIQVAIGRRGETAAGARFVPPPVPEMMDALNELVLAARLDHPVAT